MRKLVNASRPLVIVAFSLFVLPLLVFANPLSYSVANTTSGSLGSVTISCATSGTTITVGSTGTYVTEVPGSVTAVTINGYTAYYPTTTSIVLPNGHPGTVGFTSTSRVEVIDLLEGSN
jgi:hypothetical protein